MNIPQTLIPTRSFSARITWWVMLTVLIIFIIISYAIYSFSRSSVLTEAVERYQGIMEGTNHQVNNALNVVEIAIANNIPLVEEKLNSPDDMYDVVKRILQLNPNIVGSAIAFEPYFYPSKGVYFSPYAYRDSDEIKTKQLGMADYEYHYMDWYQIPKLLKKSYWSDPYYDTGGGEVAMSTFSQPLFDKEGNFFAILTADISLEWLSETLQQADSINAQISSFNPKSKNTINDTYSFIIGRNATYIAHPDKERILNETYISDALLTPDMTDDYIGYKMLEGEKGYKSFNVDGVESVIFYSPLEHTGWSMGIVVPKKVLFADAQHIGRIILAMMSIGLLILFFVCRSLMKRVTKPLVRFTDSVDEISAGNYDASLPEIHTKDEMRRLYDSFKTMQTSLNTHIEELKNVNEAKGRIESELRIARSIQMAMLPKVFPPYPEREDIDVYALLNPAKEVGGDLYDFFIRDEKLFFCVGDVSGKGIPASLIMAILRALFRTVSAHESNPAKIISSINDVVSVDNDSNMFATLFIGVFDLPTGRLRYCNAGHNAPVILNGEEVHFLDVESNIPVGIMSGMKYELQQIVIPYMTSIFVYTDGLTEAENVHQELFGEDRMIEVAKGIASMPVKEQILDMEKAVSEFTIGAEQSDDLTMMTIQYLYRQDKVIYHQQLVISNKIEEISKLALFVDEVCEKSGVDPSLAMNLNLALEEAVTNVILYAYPEGMEEHIEIEAVCNPLPKRLKFIISDWGKAFDPTTKEDVDITLNAEDRPIGGLGIHLIRQIMDSVNYERIEGKNVLTLRKRLSE